MKKRISGKVAGMFFLSTFLFMVSVGVTSASAQNFYNASYYGAVSSEYANYASESALAFYIGQDPEDLLDYFDLISYSYYYAEAAYQAAEAGYPIVGTEYASNGWLYAYYDYYYKYYAYYYAYYALSEDTELNFVESLQYMLLSDVLNDYAIFFCGVASTGGIY